jgi:hypothetical protein
VELFGVRPDVAAIVSALVAVPVSFLLSRLLLLGRRHERGEVSPPAPG